MIQTVGPRPIIRADQISNLPSGSISATVLQNAVNELDTEKAPVSSPTFTGATKFSVGTVQAGATITIPNNYQIVKITDDSASAANAVTMPTGTNGQLLIIYNGDAQATSGAVIIPAGYMEAFVYVTDAWVPLRGIVG